MTKIDYAAIFLIVAALCCGTYIRNDEWGNHVVMWEKNVKAASGKARPHLALARAYLDRNEVGDVDRAVDQAWIACQIRPVLLELFKDDPDFDKLLAIQDWNQ